MIEYHRYTLLSRNDGGLNSRSERLGFEGALIRIGGVGVGCIHPWPELGDASLDEELSALAEGNPLRLATCALDCATIDAQARRAGRWLFEDLLIPASHWMAGPKEETGLGAASGIGTVKLKVGSDSAAALALIERWAEDEQMDRLRLDFNESLAADEFAELWQRLSLVAQSKIEFVEDPFPYDIDQWTAMERKTGATLALDRQAGEFGKDWRGVLIIKPALVPSRMIRDFAHRSRDLVFTSYMDHAIGQCWAAYIAATYRSQEGQLAGLLTHLHFEIDEFFAALKCDGSVLRPPRGTGLGFDEQLEALPWKALS